MKPRSEMKAGKPRFAGSSVMTTVIFALLILIPCFIGFGNKLREFVLLYRGQVDGVFAISPIVNYLLASLGFFFLFWWGIFNGMFAEIEQPKRDFLKQEWALDQAQSRYESGSASGDHLSDDGDGPSIFEQSAHLN